MQTTLTEDRKRLANYPGKRHATRESAVIEARRLAAQSPDARFYIVVATSQFEGAPAPRIVVERHDLRVPR